MADWGISLAAGSLIPRGDRRRIRVTCAPGIGRAEVARQEDDPEASLGILRRDRPPGPAPTSPALRGFGYTATLVAAGRRETSPTGRSDAAVRAFKAARAQVVSGVPGLDSDLGHALTARGERLAMLGQRKRALAGLP